MVPEDIVILELSSFQLMGMKISPDVAVITNITPNHLNVHKDYQEYIDNLLYQVDIYAKDLVLDGQIVPARMIIIELRSLTSKFFRL